MKKKLTTMKNKNDNGRRVTSMTKPKRVVKLAIPKLVEDVAKQDTAKTA